MDRGWSEAKPESKGEDERRRSCSLCILISLSLRSSSFGYYSPTQSIDWKVWFRSLLIEFSSRRPKVSKRPVMLLRPKSTAVEAACISVPLVLCVTYSRFHSSQPSTQQTIHWSISPLFRQHLQVMTYAYEKYWWVRYDTFILNDVLNTILFCVMINQTYSGRFGINII